MTESAQILIAEDNPTNRMILKGILKKLGYQADVVNDGLEAVKTLEIRKYKLVLMDIQMPVMDGFEATKQIRDPKSKVLDHETPIIALTAHTSEDDQDKCRVFGMNDYLTKPVNPQILMEKLKTWLD